MTKPITAGDWVFWYGGLFKVLSVGFEDVPAQYLKGPLAIRRHGFSVARLEPLNVDQYVQGWYESEVKYHGGVRVRELKRVNPLSAEKRGYLRK